MADQQSHYINLLPALYHPPSPAPEDTFLQDYLRLFEKLLSGLDTARPAKKTSEEPAATDPKTDGLSNPTVQPPDALARKGLGEVLDVVADLFYPRFSFLFPQDETTFIPPLPTIPEPPGKKAPPQIDYTTLNTYLGMPHVNRWLTDFLQWLAGWVALILPEHWSVEKKRQVLAQILPLYRMRGTRQGLQKLLNFYILADEEDETKQQQAPNSQTQKKEPVEVIDNTETPHHYMQVGQFRLQDTYTDHAPVLNGYRPYTFVVKATLPTNDYQMVAQQKENLITIIEQEKPAHTTYELIIETPTLELGAAKVGETTRLGNIRIQETT